MSADVDSTTDLGTAPQGLSPTEGLCNYQWAAEGPRGAVIFYCMNSVPCNGHHLAKFDTVTDTIRVAWEQRWRYR